LDNTGIIMQRTEDEYCGGGDDTTADAWFAINLSTAKLTELAIGNERFMGASSGVTVAGLLNDPHAVLINGVKYSESKSIVADASISPAGAHVAVLRESFNPCGGGNIPNTSITLVTLANHSHVDLQNLGLAGWWGNDEIVAYPPDNAPPPPGANDYESGGSWIYTLQGKPVSQIGRVNTPWMYQGALS
jgi:hypothetical protein